MEQHICYAMHFVAYNTIKIIPSLMPLSGVIKLTPRFHGHLKASLKPLSGVIELTLPIETPVVRAGRRSAPSLVLLQFELSGQNRQRTFSQRQ